MKENKYQEMKQRKLKEIILKITENKEMIYKLDEEEKDLIIGYYNAKIANKKSYIKKLRNKIIKKKGEIL